MTRKQKVEHFFHQLAVDTMDSVAEFYHPEVTFEDPLATIRGTGPLRDYYAKMYQEVVEIQFHFSETVEQEDVLMTCWKMDLRTKKLNGGRMFSVVGTSLLKFQDDLVIYHRDTFDMGAFLYERVPLLGSIIRFFKSLLHRENS